MKQTAIVFGWLISASLTVLVSSTTIHFLRQPQELGFWREQLLRKTETPILAYNEPQGSVGGMRMSVSGADARPLLLASFLKRHQSPLSPYEEWGEILVKIADRYDLDFRLLPSIAMQESNLCKKIPEGSFNCLGLGIHSRGTWGFENYESNFEAAAKILKTNYIDIGLTTPELIQKKYTPSSNGSWQFAVNQFMARIEMGEY